jgi:hypothetical protein
LVAFCKANNEGEQRNSAASFVLNSNLPEGFPVRLRHQMRRDLLQRQGDRMIRVA